MQERSNRLANSMSGIGVEKGDRVVVILPNGIELLELMFAVPKAGAIFVPLNPASIGPELSKVLAGCSPRVVVASAAVISRIVESGGPGFGEGNLFVPVSTDLDRHALPVMGYEPLLESGARDWCAPPDRSDLDCWLLAYTSGTTGEPKGVCLSHRSKTLCAMVEALEYGSTSADRVLVNTPMCHAHALVHALSSMSVGGSITITERFDPLETLGIIEREAISEVSMVPAMYRRVLEPGAEARRSMSSLRIARSTGAALDENLRAEIMDVLPDGAFNLLYGATEAGPISRFQPDGALDKAGSVGLPFMGVELEIRDADGCALEAGIEGEVFLRSAYIFSGYYDNNEGDGSGNYERWITLGDIGAVDEDGFLFLSGRNRDFIISGGENVATMEVERVLTEHPGVAEAAVIGVSSDRWGESITAFVAMRDGCTATQGEIKTYCRSNLAPFKCPKEIAFVDALPRDGMGKVRKRELQ